MCTQADIKYKIKWIFKNPAKKSPLIVVKQENQTN